jgi:hypothetical protein
MATSRSKLAKGTRKLEMEKLIISNVYERDTDLGASELAKELGVTARTVRTYLSERRREIHGPDKVYLYVHDYAAGTETVELLTIEEAADRIGISPRELRRKFWEERRDRIAKIRAEWAARSPQPDSSRARKEKE